VIYFTVNVQSTDHRIQVQVLGLCDKYSADVLYEQGEGGLTPLHISVMAGDEAMVKLLHSFKASASVPDKVTVERITN